MVDDDTRAGSGDWRSGLETGNVVKLGLIMTAPGAGWRCVMCVLNTQDHPHPPLMKRNRQENEFINILIAQVLAPVTLFFIPMHVKVIGIMNKSSLDLHKMFV